MEKLLSEYYEHLRELHERLWNIQVTCRRADRTPQAASAVLRHVRQELDTLADEVRIARDRAKYDLDRFHS